MKKSDIKLISSSAPFPYPSSKKSEFQIVTKKLLQKMKNRYYGGGNELKEGDKIIGGFVNTYANLHGVPPSHYRPEEISLAMKTFVLKDQMIYELYNYDCFYENNLLEGEAIGYTY